MKKLFASALALAVLSSSFINAAPASAESRGAKVNAGHPNLSSSPRPIVAIKQAGGVSSALNSVKGRITAPASVKTAVNPAAARQDSPAPAASVIPGAQAAAADAPNGFQGFLRKGLAAVRGLFNAPVPEISFDGAVIHPRAASAFGLGVRQHEWVEPKLPKDIGLDPTPRRRAKGPATTDKQDAGPARVEVIPLGVAVTNEPDQDAPAIEKALRGLVDKHPERLNLAPGRRGPLSREMQTIGVRFLPRTEGKSDQSDGYSYTARRWITGHRMDGSKYFLQVEDADVRFHVRIVNGQAVLYFVPGDIGANFSADIDPALLDVTLSDDQLTAAALKRLKSPPDGADPNARAQTASKGKTSPQPAPPQKIAFLSRSITKIGDAWHAANIYEALDLDGNPTVIVAVDVHTGNSWAFNAQEFRSGRFIPRRTAVETVKARLFAPRRASARSAAPKAAAPEPSAPGITVFGRGSTLQNGEDNGPIGPMRLPHAKVFGPDGALLTETDDNGVFTIPAGINGGKPMTVTVPLKGADGDVTDADSKNPPVFAAIEVVPSRPVTLSMTLNPESTSEELAADVSLFAYSAMHSDHFRSYLKIDEPAIYTPMKGGMRANDKTMVGNAAYEPQIDGFVTAAAAAVRQQAPVQGSGVRVDSLSGLGRMLAAWVVRMFARPPTAPGAKKIAAREVVFYFENTAKGSIIYHEKTHRVYHVLSQVPLTPEQLEDPAYEYVKWTMDPVVGSDANEGGSDYVSVDIRGNDVIGNDFIVKTEPPLPNLPTYIRKGSDATKFDPTDKRQQADPHALGSLLMQTGWQSRVDFSKLESMGPVLGPLYAANLFIRNMIYLQPANVFNAVMHAAIGAMRADGTLPPEAHVIYDHATQDHAMPLPALPDAPPAV